MLIGSSINEIAPIITVDNMLIPIMNLSIKDSIKKGMRAFLAQSFTVRRTFYAKSKGPFLRVLMYHDIEEIPSCSFSVSVEVFEQQVKYLKDNFNIVSLNDAFDLLSGKQCIKDNCITITVDDSFRCFYKNAFPIVQRYKVPCCIFIETSLIVNEHSINKGFIGSDEIIHMYNEDVLFGSHTRNHFKLSKLSKDMIELEIKGSKSDLEKLLGKKVNFFAYPYGLKRHYNYQAKEIIKESGYKCAFTAINGINYPGCDLFELKRTKIERGDSLENFKKIVNGALDIWGIVDSL